MKISRFWNRYINFWSNNCGYGECGRYTHCFGCFGYKWQIRWILGWFITVRIFRVLGIIRDKQIYEESEDLG